MNKVKSISLVLLSVLYIYCNLLNPEYTIFMSALYCIGIVCSCISVISKVSIQNKKEKAIKKLYTTVLIFSILLSVILNKTLDTIKVGKLSKNEILLCILFIMFYLLILATISSIKRTKQAQISHISIVLKYFDLFVITEMIFSIIIEKTYEQVNLGILLNNMLGIASIAIVIFLNNSSYIDVKSKVLTKFYKFNIYLQYITLIIMWITAGIIHKSHFSLVWYCTSIPRTIIVSIIIKNILIITILNFILVKIRSLMHFIVICGNDESILKI